MEDLRDDIHSELAAFWSWRIHAACRTVDSALFFGGDGERQRARRRRERRAKAICATCPVLLRYDLKLWIDSLRESATYPPA